MRSPRNWFFLALCLLVPLQIGFVARDDWFTLPPKPAGDGPDYENIAYQLSRGEGWSFDWTDPRWRAPYIDAERRLPNAPMSLNGEAQLPASYAIQLARRDGLSATTARPPLLPALIALVYWVLERGPVAFATVRIVLACCIAVAGAVAVAMTARLANILTTSTWTIVLASIVTLVLACLDRTVRSYATDFLTEPLALLLLQLWLWCICELLNVFEPQMRVSTNRTSEKRVRALATLSGILLALLIYARSAIVLWLPGVWLLLFLVWSFRPRANDSLGERRETASYDRRRAYLVATRVVLVCLLACAPWWLRNSAVLETWMPLGTQGATTLVGGYSDESLAHRGEWQSEPEIRLRRRVENELSTDEGRSLPRREVRVANAASDQVRSWIAMHIRDLPKLAWYRLVNEWNPYTGRALVWKLAALLGLVYLAIRLPVAAIVIGGVILINTLMVVVLYSVGGRFLVPTYGMLYTLAGLGVASIPMALLRLKTRA